MRCGGDAHLRVVGVQPIGALRRRETAAPDIFEGVFVHEKRWNFASFPISGDGLQYPLSCAGDHHIAGRQGVGQRDGA